MDFDGNYRQLGHITAQQLTSLQEAVRGAPTSEWDTTTRQRHFQAHRYTASVILCFGPDDDVSAAAFTQLWPRWQPLLASILEPIVEDSFGVGGKIIRLMIVRLFPGYRVAPHTDDLPVLHISHRVHIPILTSGGVVFVVGNGVVPMREGQIIEINNQRQHYVVNASRVDRVHLILDYVRANHLTGHGA